MARYQPLINNAKMEKLFFPIYKENGSQKGVCILFIYMCETRIIRGHI